LGLKEEYKKLTGEEWKPEGGAPAARNISKTINPLLNPF
jgi:hypothetical protein